MINKYFKELRKKTLKEATSKTKKTNGMVALQNDILTKKLDDIRTRINHNFLEKTSKFNDLHEKYILSRGYDSYNSIFRKILVNNNSIKSDIVETLKLIAHKYKRKKLKVLDDGAGKGYFLSQLRNKWNQLGKEGTVKSQLETTAVSLTNTIIKSNINKIKIGNVSNLVPSEKYDLIMSIYGGFSYSIPEIKKEILLKYVYSLNKGGIAIFGFDELQLRNYVVSPEYNKSILISLEKRGFSGKFYTKNKSIKSKFPGFYLFVERLK